MNCPKCKKEDQLFIRECFLVENCVKAILTCENCRWSSVAFELSYDDFSHRSDCDCLKCTTCTDPGCLDCEENKAADKYMDFETAKKFVPDTWANQFARLNEWFKCPDQYLPNKHPIHFSNVDDGTFSVSKPCDCGAEVARTTHADWCSKK